MTATHRAALDAAIDELIVRRADAIAGANDDLPAERAARKAIDRAITAHVDAEIARRLACAPGVEEAMAALESAALTEGGIYATDCDAARLDDTRKALRAAIAADRDRAVVEARPTPDEALRMVRAFAGAVLAHAEVVAIDPGGMFNASKEASAEHLATRAAILRALGVEA